MNDDLNIERHIYIAAPARKVWDAITQPEIASRYFIVPLLEAEPRVGGRIAYGHNGVSQMNGEILEYEPERRFAHTFALIGLPDDPPTRVVYQMEQIGEGEDGICKLSILHDGFPSRNPTFIEVNGGWNFILSNLKTFLETGRLLAWPDDRDAW